MRIHELAKKLNIEGKAIIGFLNSKGYDTLTSANAVPEEMLEAARIDGAGEFLTLVKIVIPNIKASIISVSTTILLAALKCFDIVYSMTNGMFGTEVLASQQYKQMFTFQNYGRGSAIAILILIGVSPVIYYILKEFHNKEAFK